MVTVSKSSNPCDILTSHAKATREIGGLFFFSATKNARIFLMKLKIKRLHPQAILPNYAHPGDVGLDMYSVEECVLNPGERRIVNCGFASEFEAGFAAIVKDKSGPSKNFGVHTIGGVFDPGYRGEYNVNLINLGQEPYKIEVGQKIAQLIIYPVAIAELEEVTELADSSRGLGRFGSTGTHAK